MPSSLPPVTVCLLAALLIGAPAYAQQHVDLNTVAAHTADAVCANQVVLLGELPSHGEARAFEAKAMIVERLVDRCGFDAVLFEAPIYDFLGFRDAIAQDQAAAAQLDDAIGRFWLTRELAGWRRWLFRHATEGNLILGGIDDQVSVTSNYARATLPRLVAASSSPESASVCEQAVSRHLFWRYDDATPFDEAEQIRLQRCVRDAANAVAIRAGADGGTPGQAMLENLAGYVDRQRSPALDRDEAMYRNVLWHIERMPAGSKVIIWTATVHAARTQGRLPHVPLGARLAARWGKGVASVGFTAFTGMSSMAGRPPKPLPDAPADSLEAQATAGGTPWVFLDAPALRRIGTRPSRLLGSFTDADWSTFFDGVVVIREEVAPAFDSRE